MDNELSARTQPRERMSIGIAGKQHDLEEQHAGRPHTRTAAEPWEDELADHGLNLKEQKGTEQAQQ